MGCPSHDVDVEVESLLSYCSNFQIHKKVNNASEDLPWWFSNVTRSFALQCAFDVTHGMD